MITQDQLKDVLDRADALYKYLKIDEKKMEYEEEDLRTQAPDFWEDQKRAEEQMKKVKGIKKWLDGYQDVRTAADELQLVGMLVLLAGLGQPGLVEVTVLVMDELHLSVNGEPVGVYIKAWPSA